MKFKKLHPDAKTPVYATPGAGAFDLTAVSRKWVARHFNEDKQKWVGPYYEYGTGIALEIPTGYIGLLAERSSGSDMAIDLANQVGFIDSDYRGEILVRFTPKSNDTSGDSGIYQVGERIAQMAIVSALTNVKFEQVPELSNTERNPAGFGTTGNAAIEAGVKPSSNGTLPEDLVWINPEIDTPELSKYAVPAPKPAKGKASKKKSNGE